MEKQSYRGGAFPRRLLRIEEAIEKRLSSEGNDTENLDEREVRKLLEEDLKEMRRRLPRNGESVNITI